MSLCLFCHAAAHTTVIKLTLATEKYEGLDGGGAIY